MRMSSLAVTWQGKSLLHGLRIIQVPVNYLPRVGESSVTGDVRKTVPLGLWMIGLTTRC